MDRYLAHLNLDADLAFGALFADGAAAVLLLVHVIFAFAASGERGPSFAGRLTGRVGIGLFHVGFFLHLAWVTAQLSRTAAGMPPSLYEALMGFPFFLTGTFILVRRRFRGLELPSSIVALLSAYVGFWVLTDDRLGPGLTSVPSLSMDAANPLPPLFTLAAYAVLCAAGALSLSSGVGRAILAMGSENPYARALATHPTLARDAHHLVLLGFPLLCASALGAALLAQATTPHYLTGLPDEWLRFGFIALYALHLCGSSQADESARSPVPVAGMLLLLTAISFHDVVFASYAP